MSSNTALTLRAFADTTSSNYSAAQVVLNFSFFIENQLGVILAAAVFFLEALNYFSFAFFYQIFQIINRPFFILARLLAPKQIVDSQIGFVAAAIVAILYVAVSLWKIDYCISVNMIGCKG